METQESTLCSSVTERKRRYSNIIQTLLKTPRRSLGKPRRVPADLKGNESNNKIRSFPQIPHQMNKTPLSKAALIVFSPKSVNIPSTPNTVKQDSSLYQGKFKVTSETSEEIVNTPVNKENVVGVSSFRTPLRLPRAQRRENLLLSPAVRVEIKKEKKDLGLCNSERPASKKRPLIPFQYGTNGSTTPASRKTLVPLQSKLSNTTAKKKKKTD